jgi:microcin C transport system substrate-binding protein
MKIQQKLHDIAAFIPSFKTPYFRSAYWNWIKKPKVPGTKHGGTLEDGVFGVSSGGLFWIDENQKKETIAAVRSRKRSEARRGEPVTIIDKTFKR